jgi:hypothetical protein
VVNDAIDDVLREWDILPKDRKFDIANVTDWLIRFMGPAIERLRTEREKNV